MRLTFRGKFLATLIVPISVEILTSKEKCNFQIEKKQTNITLFSSAQRKYDLIQLVTFNFDIKYVVVKTTSFDNICRSVNDGIWCIA